MRNLLALFALALSITSASAQTIQDIPPCALAAALSSLSSSSKCTLEDLSCICRSSGWLNDLLPKVSKECSPADLDKTKSVTVALCKNLGVDLIVPSGTTGTIAPATATSATKSGASAAATSTASVVSSHSSTASAAIASATATGSATSLGPQSGLMGMMGIAMGMMVL